MIRKILLLLTAATALFSLAACSNLDVVGRDSAKAFKAVLEALPPADIGTASGAAWSLNAPDEGASLVIQWDDANSDYDVYLKADAQPFIDAGLDASKLPAGMLQDGIIVFRLDLDGTATTGNASPIGVYNQILKNHRSVIGYHTALDHYNIDLGGGNMFEWAKDMGTNDKDIVFVLNPEPFTAAGADPTAVEGWAFAKVSVDVDGKAVEVDKLLKPFDLKQ